jgi:hypothetical protein
MKYKTHVYEKRSAYTSYSRLSIETAKAIEDSCFDNIPNVIPIGIDSLPVQLFDPIFGYFIPENEAYENPGKTWNHNKKSDWYTHVPTGLRVKKVVKKSNNYDKPNGDGVCETTLTVKIPLPSRRGQNPNSHHNRTKTGNISRSIRLSAEEWELLGLLGDGSYSQGVKNILNSRN